MEVILRKVRDCDLALLSVSLCLCWVHLRVQSLDAPLKRSCEDDAIMLEKKEGDR